MIKNDFYFLLFLLSLRHTELYCKVDIEHCIGFGSAAAQTRPFTLRVVQMTGELVATGQPRPRRNVSGAGRALEQELLVSLLTVII